VTQPTFQPVNEKVLAAELMLTVRPAIPGSDAIGRCVPSNTMCSYTSSETTSRSCSQASSATRASSPGVNTTPVGLCGVFSRITRVRGVIAARSASRSGRKSGGRSVTGTRVAPAIATEAA